MRTTLLTAFLLFLLAPAFSQRPGSLDATYGNSGSSASFPRDLKPYKMVVQPDGKIVVTGIVYDPEDYLDAAVTRFTASGSIDKTLNGSGLFIEEDINAGVHTFDIAVQKDGKLLVAGVRNSTEQSTDMVVHRYHKDGKRDYTFRITEAFTFPAGGGPAIEVQSDGKIVVAAISESHSVAIFVYNPDGSANTTLYPGASAVDGSFAQLSVYQDGGFVVSYIRNDGNENSMKTIVYSSRFGEKTFNFARSEHTILKNGKIAITGNAGRTGYIRVLNAGGNLDNSFGAGGYQALPGFEADHITGQADGKLIIQGNDSLYYSGFKCYNANGTADNSFGTNGFVQAEATQLLTYGNRLYALIRHERKIAAYLLNTSTRFIKVNLHGNPDPYANREWNNWNNLKDRHFNNFFYADSTYSNISVVMSNRNGVNDNGPGYGGAGAMAPGGVLRHSSYATGPRTLTFSGLAPSKYYSFELYASRNSQTGNSTVFSIGSTSKSVSTYRNFTKKVTFTNIRPDAQGRLVLTLKSTKDYNYLNGFVMKESFDAGTTSNSAFDNEVVQVAEEKVADALAVRVFPNPSASYFTLRLNGSGPVQLRITDAGGRLVELRRGLAANSTVTFGQQYKPGSYSVEVVQGMQRSTIRLVKTD